MFKKRCSQFFFDNMDQRKWDFSCMQKSGFKIQHICSIISFWIWWKPPTPKLNLVKKEKKANIIVCSIFSEKVQPNIFNWMWWSHQRKCRPHSNMWYTYMYNIWRGMMWQFSTNSWSYISSALYNINPCWTLQCRRAGTGTF